jgi:hypothetical protein
MEKMSEHLRAMSKSFQEQNFHIYIENIHKADENSIQYWKIPNLYDREKTKGTILTSR